MTAQSPLTPDAQKKADSRRKRKAILAGGVVLGLGAAVTLAAWSDDVFANGTFNTGSFELEGNLTTTDVDSSAVVTQYQKYDTSPGGTLQFKQVLTEVTLQPNEEVFAPISLRLSPTTTVDGKYVLTGVTFGTSADADLANKLNYRVITGSTAALCNSQTPTGGTNWYSGVVADSAPGTTNPSASPRDLLKTAGTRDQLCLGVTLTANTDAVKAATATTITWRFTATANT